jgi:general secretion pathway protein M
MAKIVGAFIDSISSRFERMPEREKKLLSIFGAALLVFLIGSSFLLFYGSISGKKLEIEATRLRLGEILSLKNQYQEAKKKQEAEERRFRSNNVSLFSLIQANATRYGLTLNDLNEKKDPVGESRLMQTDVIINLKEISIDRLTAFIVSLETTEGDVVKITRLKIKTRYDKSDLLDVQMTVSTWKTV